MRHHAQPVRSTSPLRQIAEQTTMVNKKARGAKIKVQMYRIHHSCWDQCTPDSALARSGVVHTYRQ